MRSSGSGLQSALFGLFTRFACSLFLSLAASSAQAFLGWGSGPSRQSIGLANETRPPAKIFLPKNLSSGRARPLVIFLHGYSANAERAAAYFGFIDRVEARDFFLVAPQGTTNARSDSFWNATDFCCDNDRSLIDDLGYLVRLIAEVRARFNVDAKRIYLVGHSNGGFMVNRLACEQSDLFAAAATLAGGTFKKAGDCSAPKPLPYLQIHAIDDPTIRYDDQASYAGGRETVERRRDINLCSKVETRGEALNLVRPIPGADTDVTSWNDCANDAQVSLWLIHPYQGHPGSPHKPAFEEGAADRILDWLFTHRRAEL